MAYRSSLAGQTVSCMILALLLLGPWPPALAQPPTPGEVRESIRPRSPSPGQEAPAPRFQKPAAPRPEAVPDERRIRVERFVFNGNTLFSEAELRAVIAAWERKEITLAEIYGAAERLTEFYQEHGYSISSVTVPAQRMRQGVLRLEVVEGRVGKLTFEGNRRYADSFLERRVRRAGPGVVLRFVDLERELLLMNDLPGLTARATLIPGDDYGLTDIHFRTEEKTFDAEVTVDNHGSEDIGQWRAGVDFTINNPCTFGDVLSLGYTHSEAGLLRQGRISYGFPILYDGTRLNLSYSRAEYDVGGEFSTLGIDGVSATARARLSHPLIRSRRTNLLILLGAAQLRGRSDLSGASLSDDEVNFLETGFAFNRRHDSGGMSTFSGLLATNFQSNSDGTDSDALPPRIEFNGTYEHPFGRAWSGLLRGEVVLSNDAMPDSNKYAIGGPDSIRGFITSSLRGDRGAAGTLELRRFMSFKQADLMMRGFIDAGQVWYENRLADGGTSDSLVGAGVGLSVLFAKKYSMDVQWASPIDGNDSGDGDNSRLWLSFSAFF
ncbi:MAG: ShlB/FhaC/HecB family hemolysin secretion/activation protein [Desulfobacterales bacterium]|nr:ShlB/FhaC/HecB family hemolysin secretion/activation protein [Desulfobacterales bacterium]